METNKIIQGHALDVLKTFPKESIDCVMTSPAYWALRDYGNETETIWDYKEGCEHEWKVSKTAGDSRIEKRSESRGGWVRPSRDEFASRTVFLVCPVCNKDFEGKPNQRFCSLECLNKLSNQERTSRVQLSNFCSKCKAWKGQLGLEPTFDLYIKHLCDIFDEVKRTLKKSGTCWINIGDSYSGSGKGAGGDIENSKQVWTFQNKFNKSCNNCGKEFKGYAFQNFCSSACSGVDNTPRTEKGVLSSKSLCMIPFRFAIEMVNRGWILRNTIIWHKPNSMPSSVKDRFTVDFEYLFFFVKNRKYYFEQQYEPHLSSSILRTERVFSKASAFDYTKRERSNYKKGTLKGLHREMLNPLGKNKRTVWSITTHGFPEAHFATYPEELCLTPIKSGCPIDGIVLDCFFGSGTTGVVALKQNKKFIGIELNPEYIKIANERLKPYLEQTKLVI